MYTIFILIIIRELLNNITRIMELYENKIIAYGFLKRWGIYIYIFKQIIFYLFQSYII